MSFFNAVYTLGGCRRAQPIQEGSKISIQTAPQDPFARTSRWLKWLVTFPIQAVHATYNTAHILFSKDINKAVAHQILDGNGVHYMPLMQRHSAHIITSPEIIGAIAPKFRHDPQGPFEREPEERDLFITILKDMYRGIQVEQDDFLLSCSREHVHGYRAPLLEFIGPKALPRLKPQLAQIAEEVLESMRAGGSVSAKDLADTYTGAIFARLFFDLPGTLEDFKNMARAFSSMSEHQILKKFGNPTHDQIRQYGMDLEKLRSAIESGRGEFRDSLSASGLSPIRIKGELLLLFGAGTETTSSVLQYVLWHIGQDPDLQEAILNESEDVEQILSGCLKQYTPASLISRFARSDLEIVVENRNGASWKYPIAKGDALVIPPLFAKTMTFGGGVHLCPGQWLARAEIVSMVKALVSQFEITSEPEKKRLSTVPGFGFLKTEPVQLSLRKRA